MFVSGIPFESSLANHGRTTAEMGMMSPHPVALLRVEIPEQPRSTSAASMLAVPVSDRARFRGEEIVRSVRA